MREMNHPYRITCHGPEVTVTSGGARRGHGDGG